MSIRRGLFKSIKQILGGRNRLRPALEALEDRFCPSYAAIDLGTLGGVSSQASALNETGQVVGQAATASGENHAFLWSNGVMTDLGVPGATSVANDINDAGQIVGAAGPAGGLHAALWQNGVMTELAGAGSQARAINNSGQVVGIAFGAAVVWEGGVMYTLASLLPPDSRLQLFDACDINDHGQIVGAARLADESGTNPTYPFILTDDDGIFANGGAVLSTFPTDYVGTPLDLNQAGAAAGWLEFGGDGTDHAVLYNSSGYTELILENETTSYANAINGAEQVVGRYFPWAEPWTDFHAFLWQDGQRQDLNNLIDSAGWTLTDAQDINDSAQIVGTGVIGGQAHAFLAAEANLPSLTIDDVTVTEGNSGTTSAVFTVTLSAASPQVVTVAYSTTYAMANPAYPGSDFTAVAGALTFAPGETTKTISVPVIGDTVTESAEGFVVNLGSHTNAVLARSQGQGTISNDDPPLLVIGDTSITEGHSGTRAATFTVRLYYPFTQSMTVNYATANGIATAPGDYQATAGTLTFNPGETSKTITVLVKGDRVGEGDETFFVNLSSPVNAVLWDGQGVGTIVDDEPRISISDVTKAEGKKGQKTLFIFTVTLSAAYDQAVTMSFRTADGTAKKNDNDYVERTGTLTFAPGETSKTITIEVNGDDKKEANETFYLDLFGLTSNALFTKNRGLGTILNDD